MLIIGQLVKQRGVTTFTILYYQRCGVFPKLKHSQDNFRLYPDNLIPRFYFTQNATVVEFTLEEIQLLIDLQISKVPSQRVTSKEKNAKKSLMIDGKNKSLTTRRDTLSAWDKVCHWRVSIDPSPFQITLKKPG